LGGLQPESQPGQIVQESLSQKNLTQKGLVEWLKVKALSSSPSLEKKKNKQKTSSTQI
jgi:plasmid maintenance system antidote protein VapI